MKIPTLYHPPDVLLTMRDKSNERLEKKCPLLLPLVCVSKMIQSFFYIIEFCGNESTNGSKEDFEFILIVVW